MSLEFLVADTETTGVSASTHDLIEFSFIRLSTKTQCTRIIKADTPWTASDAALKITGRTKADLSKGISKEEGVADLLKFIESDGLTPEHRVIIAHNAPFDRRFLHALFRKCNKDTFPAHNWADTMKLGKQLVAKLNLPKKTSVKLDSCLKLANITPLSEKFHSASGDAQNLYAFWIKSLEQGLDYLPLIERVPYGAPLGPDENFTNI